MMHNLYQMDSVQVSKVAYQTNYQIPTELARQKVQSKF